jgi:hypothetical protein
LSRARLDRVARLERLEHQAGDVVTRFRRVIVAALHHSSESVDQHADEGGGERIN